jgi:hypothetical protein
MLTAKTVIKGLCNALHFIALFFSFFDAMKMNTSLIVQAEIMATFTRP